MNFLFLILYLCSLEAIALSSNYYPLVYDSYLLEKKGDIPKAIAKMTRIYKSESDDYFVNFRLGQLFVKDQRQKLAIDHFKKASRINSTSIDPWIETTHLWMDQKNWAELELASEEIIKRDEFHLPGHLNSIRAMIELGKYSKALERLESIISLHPLHKELLELKAISHQKNGDRDQSKKALMELILIDPENTLAKTLLSEQKEP